MLRVISCQRATLLLEQRAEQPLPTLQRRSLWLHLRYCPLCSRYAQQTALLAALAHERGLGHIYLPGLPTAARHRLREQLRLAGLKDQA